MPIAQGLAIEQTFLIRQSWLPTLGMQFGDLFNITPLLVLSRIQPDASFPDLDADTPRSDPQLNLCVLNQP